MLGSNKTSFITPFPTSFCIVSFITECNDYGLLCFFNLYLPMILTNDTMLMLGEPGHSSRRYGKRQAADSIPSATDPTQASELTVHSTSDVSFWQGGKERTYSRCTVHHR